MDTETIEQTVERFRQELEERGYSKNVRWQYGKVCRELIMWCKERGIDTFSIETVREYSIQTYGKWDAAFKLPYHKKMAIRTLRLLSQSYMGVDFESRTPIVYNIFHTDISNFTEAYSEWCHEERHLRDSSICYRLRQLSIYDNFLHISNLMLEDISLELNEKYFSQRQGSHSYIVPLKHCLREFLQFLYEKGFTDSNLSTTVSKSCRKCKPEKLPSVYAPEEIRVTINSIDRSTPKGKRDYIVMLLAAEYGLRSSDIVRLRMTNIDWDRNIISLIQYKTGMPLELPLVASIGNAIIDYMKNGHPEEAGSLIISQLGNSKKGKPLHPASLHGIIRNALAWKKGIDTSHRKQGIHSFRHSLASNMLESGIPIMTISSILGHSLKQSTQTYLKIDIRQLAKCSLSIPPLRNNLFQKET